MWNASENAGERALTGSTLAALTASKGKGAKEGRNHTGASSHVTASQKNLKKNIFRKKKKNYNRAPKKDLPSS